MEHDDKLPKGQKREEAGLVVGAAGREEGRLHVVAVHEPAVRANGAKGTQRQQDGDEDEDVLVDAALHVAALQPPARRVLHDLRVVARVQRHAHRRLDVAHLAAQK